MKAKLLFICVLSTFNLFSQTNLVPNGGFETWINSSTLSDWTSENNVTQNTQYYSEGVKSAKLTIANSATKPKILAQVPMVAGTTYTVKFKYKYLSSNYNGQHPISLQIEKQGSAKYISSNYFASNNDWTQKETTFTPDQNISYDLNISVTTFDGQGFDVLIDDVQVYIQGTEQYTLIPDANFEAKLIQLGFDAGVIDGKVLTNNINKLPILNVSSSSITDLTGIEDFVGLQILNCYSNQLTSIDVSNNVALTRLSCYSNQITSLDLSKNIALTILDCKSNQLTSLDLSKNTLLNALVCDNNSQLTSINVSKNTALQVLDCNSSQLTDLDVSNNTDLKILHCRTNKLTNLDVSKNTALVTLSCNSNELTTLNLKNGNNVNLSTRNFTNNPNLTCIQVDNDAYSNANWSTAKDVSATYKTTCTTLGIEDSVFDKVALYPSPTKDEVTITNIALEKATVYNTLGQLVKSFTLNSVNTSNTISLSGLPKGIYYVYLINHETATVKKVIVE